MTGFICFIVGLLFGGVCGVAIMAVMNVASSQSRLEEKELQNKNLENKKEC